MNATFKTLMLWLSLLAVLVLMWYFVTPHKKEISLRFSEFMDLVEDGKVKDVTITGNEIKGSKVTGEAFRTVAPQGYDELVDKLREKKVEFSYQLDQSPVWLSALLGYSLPLLLTTTAGHTHVVAMPAIGFDVGLRPWRWSELVIGLGMRRDSIHA